MKNSVRVKEDKEKLSNEISHRLMIEAAYNGIVAVNTEGNIMALNIAARRILGIGDDVPMFNRSVKVIAANLWPDMRVALSSRLPQIGKIVSIVANHSPILVDGKLVGLVSIFQKAQLLSTKQVVNQLGAIVESFDNGMFIDDGLGNTLKASLSFEKVTGARSSELTGLIGRHLTDLVSEGFISNSVTLLILESGRAVTINAHTRHGKELLITGNPIFNESGKITMVVTNVRDITGLNQLNPQLRKARDLKEDYREKLQEILTKQPDGFEIVARSEAMSDVVDLAIRIAAFTAPVLIQGETGVGKEVVARLIHRRSDRAGKGTFMKINCGAIPEHLLESELFGYEKGAFTGANPAGKKGLFELADHGTLFLDEIEALSLGLQAKLLSAVQDLEVMRVGGTKYKKIDTRIIAASNRDLNEMVMHKTFREDLFFRLNVVPIKVAPLRERKDDILPLAIYFLEKCNRKYGTSKSISGQAIDYLIQYPWPGNVRELSNVIERLVVTSKLDDIVLDDLPLEVQMFHAQGSNLRISAAESLRCAVEEFEYRFIEQAVQRYGSAKKAAAALKVDPATLCRKIQRHRVVS
jgi:PAS domain S-box-containing protein